MWQSSKRNELELWLQKDFAHLTTRRSSSTLYDVLCVLVYPFTGNIGSTVGMSQIISALQCERPLRYVKGTFSFILACISPRKPDELHPLLNYSLILASV